MVWWKRATAAARRNGSRGARPGWDMAKVGRKAKLKSGVIGWSHGVEVEVEAKAKATTINQHTGRAFITFVDRS